MTTVTTGTVDQSIRLFAFDTDGAAVTGLTHASTGIAVSVVVRSKGRIVSTTALTLVARSSPGVHTDSAFTEVGSGEYVVDLPDSYQATADRTINATLAATAITGNAYSEALEIKDAPATASAQTTILNRLGAWTGSGINTILGALRAIAAKASGLTPTDLSSGTTFNNTTDSLEAVRDAVSDIQTTVSAVTVTTTGFGAVNAEGTLILKRGHTATVTFTSSTNNVVSDLSVANTKVFFGIRDSAGRQWLSLEGTVLVATGLQSVTFTIPVSSAAALIVGIHLYDVFAVYGYDSNNTPPYTALAPFASGTVRVQELSFDLDDI